MPAPGPRNIKPGRWQTKGPVSTNQPFASSLRRSLRLRCLGVFLHISLLAGVHSRLHRVAMRLQQILSLIHVLGPLGAALVDILLALGDILVQLLAALLHILAGLLPALGI